MNAIYDDGTGEVLAINRSVLPGESSVEMSVVDLIYGMDNEFYFVVDGQFTTKDQSEVDAIIAQREADASAQAQAMAELEARVAAIEVEIAGDNLGSLTIVEIDQIMAAAFDATDFQASTDFASLKSATGDLFMSIKGLFRKVVLRVNRLSELSNK